MLFCKVYLLSYDYSIHCIFYSCFYFCVVRPLFCEAIAMSGDIFLSFHTVLYSAIDFVLMCLIIYFYYKYIHRG